MPRVAWMRRGGPAACSPLQDPLAAACLPHACPPCLAHVSGSGVGASLLPVGCQLACRKQRAVTDGLQGIISWWRAMLLSTAG